MSSDKPLRQEDYQAMAEECRRLREEVARFQMRQQVDDEERAATSRVTSAGHDVHAMWNMLGPCMIFALPVWAIGHAWMVAPQWLRRFPMLMGALGALGVIVLVLMLRWWVALPALARSEEPARSAGRTTPCYFVRHSYDEEDDARANPWDTWRVFKSPCEHCRNQGVPFHDRYVEYPTRTAAWAFIQEWKLEACK